VIWAAWRSQRLLILVSFVVVGFFAIWLFVTGSAQEAAYAVYLNHHCLTRPSQNCTVLYNNYYNANRLTGVYIGILIAIPPILGFVLGAPLVAREFEQATNRLAWTQSITRTRWLLVKLGLGALACVVVVGAMVPLLAWWTGAVQRSDRILPGNFDFSGFVAVAYVLFAFMLGAALGALIRRTGWAFAVGIPLYALVRLIVRADIRPILIPPSTVSVDPSEAFTTSAWILNAGFVPIGRSSPAPGETWHSLGFTWFGDCKAPPPPDVKQCIAQSKIHFVYQFQPMSHFWSLQALESAIYVGSAVVLLAVIVFSVQRWRT
jgi:hypothetical protein